MSKATKKEPVDNFEVITASVPDFLKKPDEHWFDGVDDILTNLIRSIMTERNMGVSHWLRGMHYYYEHVVPEMPRSKKSSDKSNLRDALNKNRISFSNFVKVLQILACAEKNNVSLEFIVRVINEDDPEDSSTHITRLPRVNAPRRRRKPKQK